MVDRIFCSKLLHGDDREANVQTGIPLKRHKKVWNRHGRKTWKHTTLCFKPKNMFSMVQLIKDLLHQIPAFHHQLYSSFFYPSCRNYSIMIYFNKNRSGVGSNMIQSYMESQLQGLHDTSKASVTNYKDKVLSFIAGALTIILLPYIHLGKHMEWTMHGHPVGIDVGFFWSNPSSISILHVCEQRRLWPDCADEQAQLSLSWSSVMSTIILRAGSNIFRTGLFFSKWPAFISAFYTKRSYDPAFQL